MRRWVTWSRTRETNREDTLTPRQILKLRRRLRESRLVFGQRFAASPRTVESWEQGIRAPSKLTQRVMVDLIRRERMVEV